MTGHAGLGDRAVIHLRGLEKVGRRAMTGIAVGRGWNMFRRFAARDGVVVTAAARFWSSLKCSTGVTRLAGNKFVRACQLEAGCQMIEIEERVRDRCSQCGTRNEKQDCDAKRSPASKAEGSPRCAKHFSSSN